jgi:hypothetical protein
MKEEAVKGWIAGATSVPVSHGWTCVTAMTI